MKTSYTQGELDEVLSNIEQRHGWDFSRMNTNRGAVPWEYIDEVKRYLSPDDEVLDIGTGGGERFISLAPYFKHGVGTDIDEEMVHASRQNAQGITNLTFMTIDEKLAGLNRHFTVIINRHAPFDLSAIKSHLLPGGYFITQQVGERNMHNVKKALGVQEGKPVITKAMVVSSGLRCVDLREYDVEYVVKDIESLVFWLNALDMLHADLVGSDALKSAAVLNHILAGNVDERGFITNEHRYLMVAALTA